MFYFHNMTTDNNGVPLAFDVLAVVDAYTLPYMPAGTIDPITLDESQMRSFAWWYTCARQTAFFGFHNMLTRDEMNERLTHYSTIATRLTTTAFNGLVRLAWEDHETWVRYWYDEAKSEPPGRPLHGKFNTYAEHIGYRPHIPKPEDTKHLSRPRKTAKKRRNHWTAK